MNEEEALDRLTADQDANNPDWDRASKLVTCRDVLLRKIVTVQDAEIAFGPRIVAAALSEMAQTLDAPESRETFVDVARVVAGKKGLLDEISYEEFTESHGTTRRGFVVVGVCLALCGTFAYSQYRPAPAIEVNSTVTGAAPDASKPLVFSVPDTTQTEAKLKSEEASVAAQSTITPARAEAEIDRLRKDLETRIIELEAKKRVYARQRTNRSSDADGAPGPSNHRTGPVLVSSPQY